MPDKIIKLSVDKNKLPAGSVFKGYRDFHVQELEIKVKVIKYRREYFETPDGQIITAELPENLNGQHFGTDLRRYILHQYHVNNVTQPKILQWLTDLGIQISAGEINNIILDAAEMLATEYEEVREAGIQTAKNISVDDTGARHDGVNGSCTVLQNEFFAYFKTTNSKSRMNFLKMLRGPHTDYVFNETALAYIKDYDPKPYIIDTLEQYKDKICNSLEEFHGFLQKIGITSINTGKRLLSVIEEAALLGSAVKHGLDPDTVLLSDGAPQFNILIHALCWIHAERIFRELIPIDDNERQEIERIRDDVWKYYRELKQYKEKPTPELKDQLSKQFDQIFQQSVESTQLAVVLARMYAKKDQLLVVLEHPHVPLHNNATESAIRCYRIKQKISGSTRSESGKQSRDIFASLIKTCRKLGISGWDFFGARLNNSNIVPYLPKLIREKASLYYNQAAPAPPL